MRHAYNAIRALFQRPVEEESGQTLVEYGLIVALLSIAAIALLTLVGQDIVGIFTKVSTTLQNATTP